MADAYDLGGRRTGSALGTGKTIATTYDSQGKPLTVTEGGRTTVYHYDLASRAVAQTQPNGLWQYNAYDDLGRLESRQTYTSADALQAQFLWTYDAVGNVTVQSERWPGEGTRGAGWRSTVMVYDATNRLTGEAMAQPGSPVITTGYAYDTGSNRSVKLVSTDGTLTTKTLYTYNHFNQLTDWSEEDGLGAVTREADLTYDLAGNRATQTLTVTGQSAQTTTYHWDAENRLEGVTLPNADEHEYGYDYRTRRISRVENGIGTAIVFSGGLSVAEYESQGITPTVEYLRGPDMGGGVGGMMYSLRNGGTEAKYAMSNGRGDVVAQSNDAGALTWTASYEAYGKRPVETGTNLDRQRANTKEEDPTGLLNEGFRYRDIETGVWLSRDPAGFVDGPNLYAYVRQNPWTSFDPLGLAERYVDGVAMSNDRLHQIPVSSMEKAGLNGEVAKQLDLMRMQNLHPHGPAGHPYYTGLIDEALPSVIAGMKKEGLDPTRGQKLTEAEAKLRASILIKRTVTDSSDAYVQWFNSASQTETQLTIAKLSPLAEAHNRSIKGQPFTASLNRRIRASGRLGMKGLTSYMTFAAPFFDLKSMGDQLYSESPAGQVDFMAASLAGDLLPPDKTPGFFGKLEHQFFGTFKPFYTEEREAALRQLHSDLREELVHQIYGRTSFWTQEGIWRVD